MGNRSKHRQIQEKKEKMMEQIEMLKSEAVELRNANQILLGKKIYIMQHQLQNLQKDGQLRSR